MTFKLRPEPEETAVQSCRNVFQAEGHMASPISTSAGGLQITFPCKDWGRESEPVGLRFNSISKLADQMEKSKMQNKVYNLPSNV